MRPNYRPLVAGLLLIGAGLLMLLANLGVLASVGGLIWGLLFAFGGGAFLSIYVRDQQHWWSLIPGCTLLGLGALVGLQELLPALAGPWGGALFLASISLGFWLIALTRREQWWAIIPGGALLSVAAIAGLGSTLGGESSGAMLFFGLALTFGLVYLTGRAPDRRTWALFPAAVLLVMAVIIQASFGVALGYIWPLALIAFGIYLGYRALRGPPAIAAAPPAPIDSLQHVERLVNEAAEPIVFEREVGEKEEVV
jgi:hypothetical protein